MLYDVGFAIQVNDLREGQNDLLQATKQKFDTFTQKQEVLEFRKK